MDLKGASEAMHRHYDEPEEPVVLNADAYSGGSINQLTSASIYPGFAVTGTTDLFWG